MRPRSQGRRSCSSRLMLVASPQESTILSRSAMIDAFSPGFRSHSVLLVAHFFHPLNRFSVERFLNRDVLHRIRRRRAVPMLFSRLEPDDIAGTDLFDRSTLALHPSQPKRHDQNLTEWMRVPRGPRSRFEGYSVAGGAGRCTGWIKRIDSHRARKPLSRSSCGWLRSTSLDFHRLFLEIKTRSSP